MLIAIMGKVKLQVTAWLVLVAEKLGLAASQLHDMGPPDICDQKGPDPYISLTRTTRYTNKGTAI